jgi:hypothetical protein
VGLLAVVLVRVRGGVWFKSSQTIQPSQQKEKPITTKTQEYKTHVSKYGFSVSYPASWFLEEEKNIKPTEDEIAGFRPFGIYNYNSETSINMNDEEKIEIDASFLTDVEDVSKSIKDKIIHVAQNRVRMSTVGMRNMHLFKGEGFLLYDTPRIFGIGEKYKYYVLLIYLPKTNSVGMITMFSLGKFTIDEILEKIKIAIEE